MKSCILNQIKQWNEQNPTKEVSGKKSEVKPYDFQPDKTCTPLNIAEERTYCNIHRLFKNMNPLQRKRKLDFRWISQPKCLNPILDFKKKKKKTQLEIAQTQTKHFNSWKKWKNKTFFTLKVGEENQETKNSKLSLSVDW